MSDNYERTQAIIEELRADIDFELDDVLAKIVNGLPEGYFRSFSNHDLLKAVESTARFEHLPIGRRDHAFK